MKTYRGFCTPATAEFPNRIRLVYEQNRLMIPHIDTDERIADSFNWSQDNDESRQLAAAILCSEFGRNPKDHPVTSQKLSEMLIADLPAIAWEIDSRVIYKAIAKILEQDQREKAA